MSNRPYYESHTLIGEYERPSPPLRSTCENCGRPIMQIYKTGYDSLKKSSYHEGQVEWIHVQPFGCGNHSQCGRPAGPNLHTWDDPTYAEPTVIAEEKPYTLPKLEDPRKVWRQESYWAEQLWDSDCNNCLHVKRIPFDRKKENVGVNGTPALCDLNDRPVRCFHPGIFSAHPCFVHRKTLEESPHKQHSPCEQNRYMD